MFILIHYFRLYLYLKILKRGGNIKSKSLFISLLLLFVVVLSASSAFAADTSDVIAVDDGIDEEVIAADAADEESVLQDESPVVTKDNFYDYFDNAGYLTSDADELMFEGDFSDLDVSAITIAGEKAVKFTGKSATFKNTQFMIMQNDVTIDGFNFITDDANQHTRLIYIIGMDAVVSNIVLSNNNITFIGPEDSEAYAIYAGADADMGSYGISGLQIINNNITYVGDTDGTEINNVIRVNGDGEEEEASEDILVQGNTFNVQIPSVKVDYGYFGEAHPVSEAIVFYYCDDVKFIDNRVDIKFNKAIGSSDTIYVVSAYGDSMYMLYTSNVTINNNVITGVGNSAIYGIKVSAETFEVSNNKINLSSEKYYANGINVDGPSTGGLLNNNTISLKAPADTYTSVYGIYGWQVMGQITDVNYTNNVIDVEAYLACGIEINQPDIVITNNEMKSSGNFTYGIAASIRPDSDVALISDNVIVCDGNNVGIASGDAILKTASAGISTLGNAVISNNKINSTCLGIISVDKGNVEITENTVNVIANENKDNYAIKIDGVESLNLNNNNVSFVGLTDGYSVITNALRVSNVTGDVFIFENNFDIVIPSVDVAWFEVPSGSGNWVSSPISEGIVIENTDDVAFDGNVVNVAYNYFLTSYGYDTIYAIDFKNASDAVITNNNIKVQGKDYIYGLIITGDNFTIRANNITSIGDYYADGIDIEGPSSGVVEDNNIAVYSNSSAYAIYSGMNGADVVANYTNNEIRGNSYAIFGFSLGDVKSNVVNNTVFLDGNYTTGIAYKGGEASFNENKIVLNSSEIGNEPIGDSFGVETVGIKVLKGNVAIVNNTIATPGKGLHIGGNQSNVQIDNNFINVVGNADKDAYAIYVTEAGEVFITLNTVDYQGLTQGTGINNAVYIYKTDNVLFNQNKFDLDLVSSFVPWKEIPEGSGNWVSFPVSQGIVVEESNGVSFDSNDVDVKFGDVVGAYDTIYSLKFLNSNNAVITNNNISSVGNSYIYGLVVTGDDFIIRSNNITSTGDYYANGIDIEGPATGIIDRNIIVAKAGASAYPVYAGMNGQPISTDITNNEIVGNAYLVYGIQIAGEEVNIENNNITAEGNYTIGIGSKADKLKVNNNNITSQASNEGNESVGDSMGTETTGIKVVTGNATISNNNVQTTGDYAADLGTANATVTDNYLAGKKAVGDNSVVNGNDVTVTGSGPNLKTILSAVEFHTVYDSGDVFYVTALDENGDPIKNATIFLTIDGTVINETTDNDGVATFFVDEWDVGDYLVTLNYKGNETYGPKSITTLVSIEKRVSNIVAPTSVNVLLTAVKKGSYYTITLKDDRDNGLAGQKVLITFNGKTNTYTTNDLGVIKFKLSATKAGTQKLTVKFNSNSNYVDSTLTATVKINKEATKLTAKKKTFKAKVKTKKYTVTLKDSKGKAIKKVKVTLKVKGKKYTAKTNAKGKATFKVKNLKKKGKYTAKVTFAGNNLYNKVAKSVKITVKK